MESARTIPADERPLFRFVAIADTHVTAEWDSSTSPFPSVAKSNRRCAAAVARIRSLRPDFVLHLGDMVHPVPGQPGFEPAVANFRDIWRALGVPLRLVPGNHDVGDKPGPWLPAPSTSPASLRRFADAFGADHHAFEHGGCRFLLLNSSLINSGLPEEAGQWAWLAEELSRGGRLFVGLHYPPFLLEPGEPSHYDNLDEPGRGRLLALLRDAGVEAVFSGHVHNVFLNRLGPTDFHVLPGIAFVRHDYAQLFAVPPTDGEFGRTTASRFGFLLVEVFARGHTVHWVATLGDTDPAAAPARMGVSRLHPRRLVAPVGVTLRHDWAHPLAIAPAGGVDELARKYVRNDYLAMRLQWLGLRHLRIPLQDVTDPVAARRMADLAGFGHLFTVFMLGLPSPDAVERLAAAVPWLAALELVLAPERIAEDGRTITALRQLLDVPVFVSPLRASANGGSRGSTYHHYVRHGFAAGEVAAAVTGRATVDGVSVRIERSEPLWPSLDVIAAACRASGRRALVQLALSHESAALPGGSPADTACRIAEAALASWAFADALVVIVDTLVDLDRGYFPRSALIDPACEPRPAGHALQRLGELLAGSPCRDAVVVDGEARRFVLGGQDYALLLPAGAEGHPQLATPRGMEALVPDP